jgi:hypothetical protein
MQKPLIAVASFMCSEFWQESLHGCLVDRKYIHYIVNEEHTCQATEGFEKVKYKVIVN